jgi:sialidase-1
MRKHISIFLLAILLYDNVWSQQGSVLSSADFIQANGNALPNFEFAIRSQKKATVAFLGGSITNMKGWREMVEQYLRGTYKDVQFTFINAGIPSLGSVPHAFRLQNDVLNKGKIDLLFIESAVNDHVNGTPATQQQRALEGIVRHVRRSDPKTDMVLMAFVDEDKIADYAAGKIPGEVKLHETIAKHYQFPFINLAREVNDRIANKEFTWADDFKNLHPSPFGQQVYFNTIRQMFQDLLNIEKGNRSVTYSLPASLYEANYSNGEYAPVENAVVKNHSAVAPDWKPADNIKTRAGFADMPVLEAVGAGASFGFSFTGTAVGIAIISGPDAGKISYSVDGAAPQHIDLFTQWSKSLHLPYFIILADDLKNAKHTLTITLDAEHNEQSKGNVCRVVHFLVNKTTEK